MSSFYNRWRGENVSTTEVENVIKKVIGLDINIYGVPVRIILYNMYIF